MTMLVRFKGLLKQSNGVAPSRRSTAGAILPLLNPSERLHPEKAG
jgi:hypothetical protein